TWRVSGNVTASGGGRLSDRWVFGRRQRSRGLSEWRGTCLRCAHRKAALELAAAPGKYIADWRRQCLGDDFRRCRDGTRICPHRKREPRLSRNEKARGQ